MIVVGLDPSLKGCGIAGIRRGAQPRVLVVGESGSDEDTYGQSAIRIGTQAKRIVSTLPPARSITLVAIEGLGRMNPAAPGRYQERCALFYRVLEYLALLGVPIAVVAPATLKKWATGNGRADKAEVLVAMRDLWPEVRPLTNNNASDALGIATMAAQHVEICETFLPQHFSPNVQWPEVHTNA